MKARFSTICRECGSPIPVDTEIVKRGLYWVHQVCKIEIKETHEPKKKLPDMVFRNLPGMCGGCEKTFGSGRRSGRYFHDKIEVCESCFDTDIKRRMWG